MSGPKGSRYSVLENRRREEARRAALREELARAREALDAAERVAEAHAAAGAAVTTTPLRLTLDDSDAASIEAAIRALRQRAEDVRRGSAAAVAGLERARTLDALAAGVETSGALTAGEAIATWRAGTSPSVLGAFDRTRVEAALAQLDPDQADAQAGLLELAARLPDASSDTQRSILEELERRVRRLNREADTRREELASVRELQLRLVGVVGPAADELRARLARVVAGEDHLDPNLLDMVGEVVAARQAVEDRLYVAESLRASLAALGYAVGDEFVTALGSDSVGYVERPGWSQHLLEVRLPRGNERVVMAAVRKGDPTAPSSASARTRDAEVESEFCDTFEPLLEQMSAHGIRLDGIVRHPPGASPMNVVQPASEGRTTRTVKQAPRRSLESP